MKKSLYLFVFIITVTGLLIQCSRSSKESAETSTSELITISLASIKNKVTVPLTELIEDCELIHFDNSDQALFKAWWIYFTVTDNYIGIRQQNDVYKLFDRSGKFLCNVGAKGHGPGEYAMSIYDEIIDEKNNRIYFTFFTSDKIQVYDLKGKYIKEIVLPYKVNKPKIHLSEKGIMTLAHMPFAGDKALIVQFDTDGNILYEMEPPERMLVQSFDGELFSYRNTKHFDLLHTGLDTLYHFDIDDHSLTPVFTTNHFNNHEEGWYSQYNELFDRFLINSYNYINGENKFLSTLKTNLTCSTIRIINDFYGGMEVTPNLFYKGYFLHNIEPEELREKIEERLSQSDCTDEDRKKLKLLQSSLDDNSNNLLFLGKLKQKNM